MWQETNRKQTVENASSRSREQGPPPLSLSQQFANHLAIMSHKPNLTKLNQTKKDICYKTYIIYLYNRTAKHTATTDDGSRFLKEGIFHIFRAKKNAENHLPRRKGKRRGLIIVYNLALLEVVVAGVVSTSNFILVPWATGFAFARRNLDRMFLRKMVQENPPTPGGRVDVSWWIWYVTRDPALYASPSEVVRLLGLTWP